MRPVGCDRAHVVDFEQALPSDVQADPRRELEPVPEARVHRVLEVRVAVHESRQDHAPRERLALAEVGGAADGGDPPIVADGDRALADRFTLDRDRPSRRRRASRLEFCTGRGRRPWGTMGPGPSRRRRRAHRASAAVRSQRRSMNTAIQMEASKSTRSGTVSSTSETGSTVGSRIANASIPT